MNLKSEILNLKVYEMEINSINKQIKELDEVKQRYIQHDSVKGSMTSFPYIYHSIHIEGIDFSDSEKKEIEKQLNDLRRSLKQRLLQSIKTKAKIEKLINEAPTPRLRQILTMRIMEGLSWNKIADKIALETGNVEITDNALKQQFSRYVNNQKHYD